MSVEVRRVGPGAYQLSNKKMSWGGRAKEPDRSVLHVTPAVTLRGIPEAALTFVVNGRTPQEWAWAVQATSTAWCRRYVNWFLLDPSAHG